MRGKNISWRHLELLYDTKLAMSARSSGLYLIQRLKQEHINLTSFSQMRVDLAVQVRTCMCVVQNEFVYVHVYMLLHILFVFCHRF